MPQDTGKALELYQAAADQKYEDAAECAARLRKRRTKGGFFKSLFGGKK